MPSARLLAPCSLRHRTPFATLKAGALLGLLFGVVASAAAALSWEMGPGYRSAPLAVPAQGKAGFARLPGSATGIAFTNALALDRYTTNQIYLNGSGVTAGDVDGDGWCDLFFAGLGGGSRFYRNLGGWKFVDATRDAGLTCAGLDATGVAFADLDGDGDLDLAVNSVGGGTWIFLNDGRGHFTRRAVLNPDKCGSSLALADIDGDGDLDLYVANYRRVTMRDEPNAPFRINNQGGRTVILEYKGRPVTDPDLVGRFSVNERGKIMENGEADVLYRNDGGGAFSALSFTDGTFLDEEGQPLRAPPYDWSMSAMFRDLNGDGLPDLYVCSDFFSPDRVWLNLGRGKFRAAPRLAFRHTSMFSMGVDFADLDRDGLDDFLVVDMLGRDHLGRQLRIGGVPPYESVPGRVDDRPQFAHNTLGKGMGDGTFVDLAYYAGVEGTDWSWTPVFLDVDLDGYEDLLITTGHERDAMNADVMERAEGIKAQQKLSDWELLNLNNLFTRFEPPNVAYRNRGNFTFEETSALWGFDTRGVAHGMCLVDLDNDGDLDIVMNNLNGEAGVYRNESNRSRVAVRLKGRPPNTAGIGARVTLRGGPVERQTQEIICGGRYLSSDQAMRVFAAGAAAAALSLEVTWRGGARSLVTNVQPNRVYEVDEAGARADPKPRSAPTPEPLFQDASPLLLHVHHEDPFDDFARQPLLPWRLSQFGPGVAWHDVDGDGWEDLIVGSGKGGRLAVFHNDGHGGFSRWTNGPLNRLAGRDQTGLVGMGSLVLVGSANYEDGSTNGGSLRIYDVVQGAAGESVLGPLASTGPLALGDIDGDGDLDLFVGGRVVAGHYGEPALSQWLRNEGGRFVPAQRWEKLGLVSGAVLSDLDGDGKPELILACEWGPVRVFRFEGGKFQETTEGWGLAGYHGWWHGVTTGDVDGDGRLDIVASNWGKNSRYAGSRERPWKLYYGDLSGAGQTDLIEARWDPAMGQEVPERGWRMVRAALPFLVEKISGYEAYGRASVQDIYADRLARMSMVDVNTTATMVFLNRGNRFEAVELPAPAQWAPAFGVCVADADGDGVEDIFLSQNFFALNPETGRQDAGRGLWLRGDGQGGWRALSSRESGVEVYGEQRGCAVGDYDGDGRLDLVVAQNGAATRLYHNVGARPGLRVRLRGPAGNPAAVGAALRVEYGSRRGPIREIHGGSGYWSEDGAVQVLGLAGMPTGLWVRWPGGKEVRLELPSGARDVEVTAENQLKVNR